MDWLLERIQKFDPLFQLMVVVASAIGIYLAYKIGVQQNEINRRAVQIQDFVEVFVYPAQLQSDAKEAPRFNLNVVNVSTRPVYLNSYVLNGQREQMGGGALPNVGDHWYAVPIPSMVQASGTMDLKIEFEDYLGQHFSSHHTGVYQPSGWKIMSEKSQVVGEK